MHDALVIAIPTLTIIFAALLNRNDIHALRGELQTFRGEVREEFQRFRDEVRSDSQSLRSEVHDEFQSSRNEVRADLKTVNDNVIGMRERIAKLEERTGVKSATTLK